MKTADKHILSDHTKNLVEKARKYLNKKHINYTNLTTTINQMKETFEYFDKTEKSDKPEKLDIIKFFGKYKFWSFLQELLSYPDSNTKLSEQILEALLKFFYLNIPELLNLTEMSDAEITAIDSLKKYYKNNIVICWKKRVLDSIIDTIAKQFSSNDEDVWIQILKLTEKIFFSDYLIVHQESILKMYKLLTRIIISSKRLSTLSQAKSLINELSVCIFTKVDNDELFKFIKDNNLRIIPFTYNDNCTNNALIANNNNSNFNTNKELLQSNKYAAVVNTPIDKLVHQMLTQAVDDICVFFSRIEEETALIEQQNNSELNTSINHISQNNSQIQISQAASSKNMLIDKEGKQIDISNITDDNFGSNLNETQNIANNFAKTSKTLNTDFNSSNFKRNDNSRVMFNTSKIQQINIGSQLNSSFKTDISNLSQREPKSTTSNKNLANLSTLNNVSKAKTSVGYSQSDEVNNSYNESKTDRKQNFKININEINSNNTNDQGKSSRRNNIQDLSNKAKILSKLNSSKNLKAQIDNNESTLTNNKVNYMTPITKTSNNKISYDTLEMKKKTKSSFKNDNEEDSIVKAKNNESKGKNINLNSNKKSFPPSTPFSKMLESNEDKNVVEEDDDSDTEVEHINHNKTRIKVTTFSDEDDDTFDHINKDETLVKKSNKVIISSTTPKNKFVINRVSIGSTLKEPKIPNIIKMNDDFPVDEDSESNTDVKDDEANEDSVVNKLKNAPHFNNIITPNLDTRIRNTTHININNNESTDKNNYRERSNTEDISGLKPNLKDKKSNLATNNKQKGKKLFSSFVSNNSFNSSFRNKFISLEEKLIDNINIQANFPLRLVPLSASEIENNSKYYKTLNIESIRTINNPNLKNEINELTGCFGWCSICRLPAEFYCKETRAPICSLKCKSLLLKDETFVVKFMNDRNDNFKFDEENKIFDLLDSVSIFNSLVRLMSIPLSSSLENVNLKAKVIALEQLNVIFNLIGNSFTTSKEVILIVREDLMEALIRNSLIDDYQLFSLSISLFFKVWKNFRQDLKVQIGVFIEKVLLKILESDNSDYSSKKTVLEEFYKISGSAGFYIELYVNYDCDLDEKDLLNRIVNNICKIGQGKYAKYDHINKEEEFDLRVKSLATVTLMITSLFQLAQDQISREFQEKKILDNKRTLNNSNSNDYIINNNNTNNNLQYIKKNSFTKPDMNQSSNCLDDTEDLISNIDNNNNNVNLSHLNSHNLLKLKQNNQSVSNVNSNTNNLSNNITTNSNFNPSSSFNSQNYGNKLFNNSYNLNHHKDLREKLNISKQRKNEIRNAVEKFNIKIKNGLNYLRKINIVTKENEAKDIALFFKTAHGLSKELVGEYLGENNELSLSVLDHYTDLFNFKGKRIIESIRRYLSSFKLPGEGQKIDRIMQRFANKYSKDNPVEFVKADLAYYIAFAVIMIQTEIHNPHVKNKRGVKGFIDMCRAFGTEEELSDEYLESLYKEIELKPITLVEFEEMKEKSSTKEKSEIFKIEAKRLYEESYAQLRESSFSNEKKKSIYFKVTEIEHIESMINSIWSYLLAVYSLNLEDCDDWTVNSQCIEGIAFCIKLCGLLNLKMLQDAFIKYLIKLAFLLQGKEIQEKHITCLKTVLTIARKEMKSLHGSWRVILSCISSVEFYHSAISGSKYDMEVFLQELKAKKKNEDEIKIEKQNLEKLMEISPDDYDFIFLESSCLNEESFLEFVKALCDVSRDELLFNTPRIFSLQKLVEVADLNMDRIQIQWFKIWRVISDYLIEVGSNPSPSIAEKAIDSLRQLARKFLLKEELSLYHFQKEFLQPFEAIYLDNKDVYRTKEYVITCVNTLVLQEVKYIRSGWIVIFSLFSHVAEDENNDIVRKTFDAIIRIFNNNFNLVKDVFPELSSCLTKFSHHFPEDVINMFFNCYHYLDNIQHIHSLFMSLSYIVLDERENVRKLAVVTLFNLVNKLISNFNTEYWEIFFSEIIFRLCQTMKLSKASTTLEALLVEVCELFSKYYNQVEFMLEDFMEEIIDTIINVNEAIALAGLETLKYMIIKLHDINDLKFWTTTCITISEVFNKTNQIELLSLEMDKLSNESYIAAYQEIIYRNIVYCIIQHNLIELCESVFLHNYLHLINSNECLVILNSVKNSFSVAYKFNCEFELRKQISTQYMADLNQVAALFKQQQDGTGLYFRLLLKIYFYENNKLFNDEFKKTCRDIAIKDSILVLEWFSERVTYYNEDNEMIIENERLVNNMFPIIIDYVVPCLWDLSIEDEEFEIKRHILLVISRCMLCQILEVRIKLSELMEKMLFSLSLIDNSNTNNNNNDEITNNNSNKNNINSNEIIKSHRSTKILNEETINPLYLGSKRESKYDILINSNNNSNNNNNNQIPVFNNLGSNMTLGKYNNNSINNKLISSHFKTSTEGNDFDSEDEKKILHNKKMTKDLKDDKYVLEVDSDLSKSKLKPSVLNVLSTRNSAIIQTKNNDSRNKTTTIENKKSVDSIAIKDDVVIPLDYSKSNNKEIVVRNVSSLD